jgi:hypothetical protein
MDISYDELRTEEDYTRMTDNMNAFSNLNFDKITGERSIQEYDGYSNTYGHWLVVDSSGEYNEYHNMDTDMISSNSKLQKKLKAILEWMLINGITWANARESLEMNDKMNEMSAEIKEWRRVQRVWEERLKQIKQDEYNEIMRKQERLRIKEEREIAEKNEEEKRLLQVQQEEEDRKQREEEEFYRTERKIIEAEVRAEEERAEEERSRENKREDPALDDAGTKLERKKELDYLVKCLEERRNGFNTFNPAMLKRLEEKYNTVWGLETMRVNWKDKSDKGDEMFILCFGRYTWEKINVSIPIGASDVDKLRKEVDRIINIQRDAEDGYTNSELKQELKKLREKYNNVEGLKTMRFIWEEKAGKGDTVFQRLFDMDAWNKFNREIEMEPTTTRCKLCNKFQRL